jgi:hypothetical protein
MIAIRDSHCELMFLERNCRTGTMLPSRSAQTSLECQQKECVHGYGCEALLPTVDLVALSLVEKSAQTSLA